MTAPGLDRLLMELVGLVVAVVGFLVLRRSPRLAIVLWLVVIAFVPIWWGTIIKAYLPAASLMSIVVALSLARYVSTVRWTLADAGLLGVLALVALEQSLGLTTLSATFDMFTSWSSAYVVGRLILQVVAERYLYSAVAVVFSLVAALAIAEFVTGTNVFIDLLGNGSSLFSLWGTLQPRGGVLRAEGAFGHSIALGCSLAIAATLSLASGIRPWLRLGMVAVMCVAIVLTFSRIGLATVALGIVLVTLCVRGILSRGYRTLILVLTALAGLVTLYVVRDIFAEAGAEAEGSALYRSDLFGLTSYLSPLGLASNYGVSTSKVVSIGSFGSIDNAVLLFGLIYGWVPVIVPLVLLIAACVHILRGRATAPVVAMVAQIPAFLTVALITQYAAVVWFLAGLAVASHVTHHDGLVSREELRRPEASSGNPAVNSPAPSTPHLVRETQT